VRHAVARLGLGESGGPEADSVGGSGGGGNSTGDGEPSSSATARAGDVRGWQHQERGEGAGDAPSSNKEVQHHVVRSREENYV